MKDDSVDMQDNKSAEWEGSFINKKGVHVDNKGNNIEYYIQKLFNKKYELDK